MHPFYAVLCDGLGLAVRPFALLVACMPGAWPTLEAMLQGRLLLGLMGTVSALLVGLSLMVLTGDLWRPLGRLIAAAYAVDGLAQLPALLVPGAYPYPMSHSGLPAATVQVLLCPLMALEVARPPPMQRLWLLGSAVALRYMSLTLAAAGGAGAWGLYAGACVACTFAVTPRAFWYAMYALDTLGRWARYVASSVYAALEYLWPRLRDFVKAILQLPLLVGLYRRIVVPVWEALTPWAVPAALVAVAVSCGLGIVGDVRAALAARPAAPDPGVVTLALARLYCGSAAAVAAVVLISHAATRLCRREQPDPLRCAPLAGSLRVASKTLSLPWLLLRRTVSVMRRFLGPVLDALFKVLEFLWRFAFEMPLLSIPCVIVANVLVIRSLPSISAALAPSLAVLASVAGAVQGVGEAAAGGTATDSRLALALIIVVQMAAHATVAGVLDAVRQVRTAAARGHVLGLEELNALAAAMTDPRQCGRCGFGPVDHSGCSDLRYHHMEIRVRGGSRAAVSNACPRCGWFTGRLQDWAPWDGEMQTERGRAMFRQRMWCEVAITVRAASKALLVPYSVLRLGAWLALPPSLAAFLALSYLVPWAVENASLAASLNNPDTYRHRAGRRAPRPAPSAGSGYGTSCGAAPAPQLPRIAASEALANVLAAVPERVFLAEGETCSICLEPFTAEAVNVAAAQKGAEAAAALQALDPPVVALRCGHALHVECAEAAVSAAAARHVRCPLCREPVTLAGGTTAAIFS